MCYDERANITGAMACAGIELIWHAPPARYDRSARARARTSATTAAGSASRQAVFRARQ